MREQIKQAALETIRRAVIYLPPDVKEALRRAYGVEDNEMARLHLSNMLRNVELAESLGRPLCEDTGIVHYYVRVGATFPGLGALKEALLEAVKEATLMGLLRPNAVDPIRGFNTGDNVGKYVPQIHVELVEGDALEVTVVPRGGGADYVSYLEVIPPGEGLKAIKRAVVDAALRAGPLPCPPVVVGVGIGGTPDLAIHLAKRAACLRRLGTPNPDPELAALEAGLLEAVNELGVGPMGVGGRVTALAVHTEWAHRHPAALPVGVAFQCWALRRATLRMDANGKYEVTQ